MKFCYDCEPAAMLISCHLLNSESVEPSRNQLCRRFLWFGSGSKSKNSELRVLVNECSVILVKNVRQQIKTDVIKIRGYLGMSYGNIDKECFVSFVE